MNIHNLKKGDVIFVVDETEKNISSLSAGFGGCSYYHCALYIGDGRIIEAVTVAGVIQAKLAKHLDKKKLVARVSESINFLEEVITNAKQFIDFSYNDLFLPDTKGKLYCSELIHIAFNSTNNSKYFTQHKLNYIVTENCSVSQYWLNFYSEHGLKVPQGQPGSHPNNLSLDDKFTSKAFLSNI